MKFVILDLYFMKNAYEVLKKTQNFIMVNTPEEFMLVFPRAVWVQREKHGQEERK